MMNPSGKSRLAISFWIWALWDTGARAPYRDLDLRMRELTERGFNCIRIESGACLAHHADGTPRGEVGFLNYLPGHGEYTRQMEHMTGGRVDLRKRLLELCAAAKRHNVKVILSSWYYLHTFWFADAELNAELMGVPPEDRFDRFARGLDYLLCDLRAEGLDGVIAFAEIFNEADGLSWILGYGNTGGDEALLHEHRARHEAAIQWLRERHPGTVFAYDTYTAWTNPHLIPRNAQLWVFHSYYLWSVYDLLERDLLRPDSNPDDPERYAPIRQFLRRDIAPFRMVCGSRNGRPPFTADWFRRIWLYGNLDPDAMPELERLLRERLHADHQRFRKSAADAARQAVVLRDEYLPGVPLVLGEGASYCADCRLRWEERSDVYWDVVEDASRGWRDSGFLGAVVRTNSGPEDPVWHEYPERLRHANAVFLGTAAPTGSVRFCPGSE